MTDPPVKDRRRRTPTNRWSRIVNSTRSRLGTRIRAGRSGLTDAGDLGAILKRMQTPAWSGQINQDSQERYCCKPCCCSEAITLVALRLRDPGRDITVRDTPRTDPDGRSLAHPVLIADDWR